MQREHCSITYGFTDPECISLSPSIVFSAACYNITLSTGMLVLLLAFQNMYLVSKRTKANFFLSIGGIIGSIGFIMIFGSGSLFLLNLSIPLFPVLITQSIGSFLQSMLYILVFSKIIQWIQLFDEVTLHIHKCPWVFSLWIISIIRALGGFLSLYWIPSLCLMLFNIILFIYTRKLYYKTKALCNNNSHPHACEFVLRTVCLLYFWLILGFLVQFLFSFFSFLQQVFWSNIILCFLGITQTMPFYLITNLNK